MRLLKKVAIALTAFCAVAAGTLILLLAPVRAEPAPPIETPAGPLQGSREGGVTVYRGIPYAAAPVGALRWRPPQPTPRWTAPRTALAFSAACVQAGSPFPGFPPERLSEDCLYLNVWTPAAAGTKRPVMVFLHGGGLRNGSAATPLYNGRSLASKGVLVVSLNYRIGALGFLAHPELSRESGYHGSGDYGLLDTVAALHWVQTNAPAFGGDPRNVTVFGQSAGSWIISRLATSPLGKGLFVRAIGQSSADFGPTAPLSEAEAAGLALAREVGAHSLAELRAVPADGIAALPADKWPASPAGYTTMATRDGHVLTGDVRARYRSGAAWRGNLILGYTRDEGTTMMGAPLSARDWIARLRERGGPFAERLLAMYPAGDDAEAARSQARFTGEFQIKWHMAAWAREHAAARSGDVYLYRFSHPMPFGPVRVAGHGAELGYVFDFPPRSMRYTAQSPLKALSDSKLVDTVQSYWLNFAAKGDPNGSGLPEWPAYNRTGLILEIDEEEATAVKWQDLPEHELMDAYMAWLEKQGPGAKPVLP